MLIVSLFLFGCQTTKIGTGELKENEELQYPVAVNPDTPAKQKRVILPQNSNNIHGEFLLQFVVNEKGIPNDIKIIESNNSEMEEAVIQAVKKWRYEPATKDNKPVPCNVRVPIIF